MVKIEKTEQGFGRTRNEIGSEYLKNGCNDFLPIRYVNAFLHIFKNALVVYYIKIYGSSNLAAKFYLLKVHNLEKMLKRFSLNTI